MGVVGVAVGLERAMRMSAGLGSGEVPRGEIWRQALIRIVWKG